MAATLNKVMLIGNLTRDPELRYIPSGQPVASFSIAVNSTFNSKSGEKREEVSFVRIVAWARLAEVANEYLKKGSPVFVEGRLQSRSWEAQDGSKRSTTEVVAQNIQFLSRPSGGAGGGSQDAQAMPVVDESIFEESAKTGGPQGLGQVSEKELKPDEEIPF